MSSIWFSLHFARILRNLAVYQSWLKFKYVPLILVDLDFRHLEQIYSMTEGFLWENLKSDLHFFLLATFFCFPFYLMNFHCSINRKRTLPQSFKVLERRSKILLNSLFSVLWKFSHWLLRDREPSIKLNNHSNPSA